MRYAGPREGLLHATFRQNYGVNNMLIGRDHAGVGDFYGLFEAQDIFDRIPVTGDAAKDLLCKPMKIDWTFYCHECDGMASLRTCNHKQRDPASFFPVPNCVKPFQRAQRSLITSVVMRFLLIFAPYYEGLTEKVEVKMQGAASGESM